MSAFNAMRNKVSGRDGVSVRLAGLEVAVNAARGRVEAGLVEDAEAVVTRAAERLRLSPDHTVVALVGATGSGKSSLFNLLCGLDLAAVGVKRPTTSWALACSWGDGAEELLEWLGVPPRHQVNRASSLDVAEPQRDLQGLVLLDLPDHDSTEVSHHLEVERLVRLADVLVWVLDPQKYADAAIHDRLIRPLASHHDVMLAVLNHIDELGSEAAEQTLADAGRLLLSDGLVGVPLIATSATRGDGMDELRGEIVRRVDQKRSARARVAGDIEIVARRLSSATGSVEPAAAEGRVRDELVAACSDAAGVPVVVAALEESLRLRSRRATGWPLTRWVSRLRADPLRALHLGRRPDAPAAGRAVVGRTSLPTATAVQRARVSAAVRQAADAVSGGLPASWQTTTHTAATSRAADVSDALDVAVARTDIAGTATPTWWGIVRGLQWVLLVAALVGVGWLVALGGIDFLAVRQGTAPRWLSVPIPTWLVVAGLVLGIGLAAAGRWVGDVSARRRSRKAESRLRAAVGEVVDSLVMEPIRAELEAYRACRDGLVTALGD